MALGLRLSRGFVSRLRGAGLRAERSFDQTFQSEARETHRQRAQCERCRLGHAGCGRRRPDFGSTGGAWNVFGAYSPIFQSDPDRDRRHEKSLRKTADLRHRVRCR